MSRKLKYIITLDEKVIDKMERAFSRHPKVSSTDQDSGNWYTNGETGPEWHTVHVHFLEKDQDEVKAHLDSCMRNEGVGGSFFLERDYS